MPTKHIDQLRGDVERLRDDAKYWAGEAERSKKKAEYKTRQADILADQIKLAEYKGRKMIDPETFGLKEAGRG